MDIQVGYIGERKYESRWKGKSLDGVGGVWEVVEGGEGGGRDEEMERWRDGWRGEGRDGERGGEVERWRDGGV